MAKRKYEVTFIDVQIDPLVVEADIRYADVTWVQFRDEVGGTKGSEKDYYTHTIVRADVVLYVRTLPDDSEKK